MPLFASVFSLLSLLRLSFSLDRVRHPPPLSCSPCLLFSLPFSTSVFPSLILLTLSCSSSLHSDADLSLSLCLFLSTSLPLALPRSISPRTVALFLALWISLFLKTCVRMCVVACQGGKKNIMKETEEGERERV